MSSGKKVKKSGRSDQPRRKPGADEHQHDLSCGPDALQCQFGMERESERGYEHGHDHESGHEHGHTHVREHSHSHEHRRGEREGRGGRGFFAPHGGSPAENAMGALMMTAKMIHRFGESRISQNKQYSKLSGPRMGVLFIVHHSGGIRMGDLAARLHVAPRTVTDLVDGLERDGFLHRVTDPRDRRASILELSEFAKKDFERISDMRRAFVEEIFSPLSNEEKDSLVALLGKLREGPIRDLLNNESNDQSRE